jgi:murein L,D-transpeptidase YcbB/YkuD
VVESAVRGFQERHGLVVDGRVGAATLAALNVPVGNRIRQLELNLERWRWLPRAPASRFVLVNSVAFELQLVEDEHAVMVARVIVGRPDWPTPIVSGALTHLVLNPVWNVPRSIAVQEVAPLIRSDTGYLGRAGMEVLLDSGGAARRVDPASVDWTAITDSTFPYRLVQAPGPTNPLGRLKLVFRNPFNVALHDTPASKLFSVPNRTLSHGCIRVDRLLDLAIRLLGNDPRWPPENVARVLEEPRERWIALLEPVPVYVGYWTAWVGSDGMAEFRDDPYGWDGKLAGALERIHPDFTRD